MNPSAERSPDLDDLYRQFGMDDYSRAAAGKPLARDCTEQAAAEYAARPDKLANDTPPSMSIQREQPIHVLMCYMLAGGKTRRQIAEATGYSYTAVLNVSKQPWFRKRYLELAREAGMDQVEAFVKGESLASLETLVEVRDNSQEKGATRVAAANAILDRALGKPTVHVQSETALTLDAAASTATDIDRQIAAIQSELQQRGINVAGRS